MVGISPGRVGPRLRGHLLHGLARRTERIFSDDVGRDLPLLGAPRRRRYGRRPRRGRPLIVAIVSIAGDHGGDLTIQRQRAPQPGHDGAAGERRDKPHREHSRTEHQAFDVVVHNFVRACTRRAFKGVARPARPRQTSNSPLRGSRTPERQPRAAAIDSPSSERAAGRVHRHEGGVHGACGEPRRRFCGCIQETPRVVRPRDKMSFHRARTHFFVNRRRRHCGRYTVPLDLNARGSRRSC